MPYSGGSYTTPVNSWAPAVSGTAINATDWETLRADLQTALSTCVLKDGSQTITANLPMNSFKLTGLAAGSGAGDSTRYEQVMLLAGGTMTGTLAVPDNKLNIVGNADATKIINFSAASITTGTTRTYTMPDASDTVVMLGATQTLTNKNLDDTSNTAPLPRSYLAGLTLSTAGSSGTMSIAAGVCRDSTNVSNMVLAAFSKTTSTWAVGTGNGGLDTGTIANTTWYHFWVIKRTDTGVVDVLISLSATSPTLPANYTISRRIGSGKTDGSAHWTAFVQDGDYFRLSASVLDVNTTNPGTSAITATLASVPTGVNVFALLNARAVDTTPTGILVQFSDLAAADEAPSASAAPLGNLISTAAGDSGYAALQIRTNTSAQIRYRCASSGASTVIKIATLGWLDYRGKNA